MALQQLELFGADDGHQTLDFYHESEYVGKAAMVMFKGKGTKKKEEREAWLGEQLHQLKHKRGAAGRLLLWLDKYVLRRR